MGDPSTSFRAMAVASHSTVAYRLTKACGCLTWVGGGRGGQAHRTRPRSVGGDKRVEGPRQARQARQGAGKRANCQYNQKYNHQGGKRGKTPL